MSSAANLPVSISLDGVESFKQAAREVTNAFAQQVEAAARATPAVASASEAFDRLGSRVTATQRGINDLRGAMELLGATGAAGSLGTVASTIGNVADLFGTAATAAGTFAGGIGRLIPVLGAAGLAAAGLYAAYQQITAQVALYGTEQERLTRILDFSKRAQDGYRAAIDATDSIMQTAEQRTLALANARRQQAIASVDAAEAANRLAVAEAGRIQANLRGSLISAEEDPGPYAAMGFGGISPADRTANVAFLSRQSDLVRERLAELQVQAAALAERRVQLGNADGRIVSSTPFGPDLPPAAVGSGRAPRVAGGGGAGATDSLAAFNAAERLARAGVDPAAIALQRGFAEAERDAAQSVARLERQSIDAFARMGETAADRIGTGLVTAFLQGERGALNFSSLLSSVIASAGADLVKLGLINPASNALFPGATARPTLGAALGGDGGGLLSSFGQIPGLSSVLPSGGFSGLMSTPLWGGAVQGPALPGLAASGAPTRGAARGGVGGGVALGSRIGGVVAGDSQARQLNSQIGAGGGAAAGALIGTFVLPGIGTVAGGLIGGALGGAGGGLLGPGAGFEGGDALIAVNPDGTLSVAGGVGKNFATGGLVSAARGQVSSLNSQLAAAGLFFDPTLADRSFLTAIGGGQSTNARDLGGALAGFGNTLRSNDPRIAGALARAGGTDFQGALGVAQQAQALIATLDGFAASAGAVADPLAQIRAQFDALRATAERLGFGLDEVNRAQERALAIASAQTQARNLSTALGQSRTLSGFLDQTALSTGSPQSQFAAAQQQFASALGAARAAGGRSADLTRVASAGSALLAANRDFNATGVEGAAVEQFVRSSVVNLGAQLDLPGFTGDLDGTISRWGAAQVDELQQLRVSVEAMREELRGIRLTAQRAA